MAITERIKSFWTEVKYCFVAVFDCSVGVSLVVGRAKVLS